MTGKLYATYLAILVGTIARLPEGYRLDAQLVLSRDVRMRQPFAPVTAASADEAADAWTRLFATDTSNFELGERVVWALLENENAAAAEPIIVELTAAQPYLPRVFQLQWRVANANRHWPLAIRTGEALLALDSVAALDSTFVARRSTVYELDGQRYQAMATAARGVAAIPHAAQLYALYTRLVQMEADTVLPRGLALFPQSAELLAMNASELREQGKLAEAGSTDAG